MVTANYTETLAISRGIIIASVLLMGWGVIMIKLNILSSGAADSTAERDRLRSKKRVFQGFIEAVIDPRSNLETASIEEHNPYCKLHFGFRSFDFFVCFFMDIEYTEKKMTGDNFFCDF